MKILGIHSAVEWEGNTADQISRIHDAGATLFEDGKHLRSISEERLTRKKYEGNWPEHSINYCLEGICFKEDIDIVAYSPSAVDQCNKGIISGKIAEFIHYRFPNAKIWYVGHHLSHAASAVFTSPFNSGSFLTLDGMGSAFWDFAKGVPVAFENNSIGYFDKDKRIFRSFTLRSGQGENSFGDYYMNMAFQIYQQKKACNTDTVNMMHYYASEEDKQKALEFSPEGKVMGLSAYGKPIEGMAPYTFSSDYPVDKLGVDQYEYLQPWVNFHKYDEVWNALRGYSSEDIAYYTQSHYEDAIVKLVTSLKENYLEEDTCFAGGCFLNVCANTLLKPLFRNIHIPPYTNDTGIHFGAAIWASYKCKESIVLPDNIALLGKSYDDYVPEGAEHFEDFDMLCEVVARLIDENKIIGWFQGRSEHGPRALGSRSILMSPKRAENKDIINERVKHREYWRPFAGVILEEHVGDYFLEGFDTPYMLFSQHSTTTELPAITHEDKSCRIQTVNDKLNPELCTLLRKMDPPVLLNTSFNDNGEPIVETPEDAIMDYEKMDIDCLVIGNYLYAKAS